MAAGGQADKTADAQPKARKTAKKRSQEWGPFLDYTFVQAPTGEFGVPQGEVLSFGTVEVMNKETFQMEKKLVPEYRDGTKAELKKAKDDYAGMMEALSEDDS